MRRTVSICGLLVTAVAFASPAIGGEAQLAAALKNCLRQNARLLDDGISGADVVARGVTASCSGQVIALANFLADSNHTGRGFASRTMQEQADRTATMYVLTYRRLRK